MHKRLLAKFPVKQENEAIPITCCLKNGLQRILGIAIIHNNHKERTAPASFSLMQLDMTNGTIISDANYSCSCNKLEAIQLHYDGREDRWVIVTLESFDFLEPSRIRMYIVNSDSLILSGTPILLEEAIDTGTDLGPLLGVTAHANDYSIFYMKPKLDNLDAPTICLGHIKREKYQEQVSVEEITMGEKALAYISGEHFLLLICRPEYGEFSEKVEGVPQGVTGEWHISIVGWKGSTISGPWEYTSALGLPVGDRWNPENDFIWFVVGADTTTGPTIPATGQQTFIIGITLIDTFDYQAHGYTPAEESQINKRATDLFCIDINGKLIQRCHSQVGTDLHLSFSNTIVVGIDVIDDRRRLWNWSPLNETELHSILWLDQEALRTSVFIEQLPEPDIADHFWLIEEYREQVKISKRSITTLREVVPTIVLADVHLLSEQKNWRYLAWDKPIGIMPGKSKLLLLAGDKDQQLGLYQVE